MTTPTRDRLREAAKKAVDARAKADANQNDINLVHRADEADWELGELLDGETILSLLDDLARAEKVVTAAVKLRNIRKVGESIGGKLVYIDWSELDAALDATGQGEGT